jgi:hypothetical protein
MLSGTETGLDEIVVRRLNALRRLSASGITGGFNQSVQHSNLLAEMECGHEAATSHLLFCSSAV